MNNKVKPILSLCIPTYNRASFLDENLKSVVRQIKESGYENTIELIVSDNCSPDNTPEVVQRYIDTGVNIQYYRNESNLGSDGNFVSCFHKAQGNFIWLLGDDDYLVDGALQRIMPHLMDKNVGLVHLGNSSSDKVVEYNDAKKFLCEISIMVTFMSANIVNTKFIKDIEFERYMGSYFIQVPLYMTAANNSSKNIILDYQILDTAKDAINNGGYNYFEIFLVNYLGIWKSQMQQYADLKKIYRRERKNLFKNNVVYIITKVLIFRRKGNFKTKGAYRLLFKYYGLMPEAYYYMVRFLFCRFKDKVLKTN